MTAPHFHTTAEIKSAIAKIEHNSSLGPPTSSGGGSGSNQLFTTPGVTHTSKGGDDIAGGSAQQGTVKKG